MGEELPLAVREQAIRLARAEHEASETERKKLETERDRLLREYGFSSRIREDDEAVVLVCFPETWLSDGTVDRSAITDIDRAIELPIAGGEDQVSWEHVSRRNERIVETVRQQHGEIHGQNAAAFADFMNNHRAKSIGSATDEDITEFLTEYYQRNAWPTAEQKRTIEESIRITRKAAEKMYD